MDIIEKDSSMIINIQIKEKVAIKEFLLIIFREINIQIDKKEVEVEVEIAEVEIEVEVGEEEVVIVDIGIEI